MHWHGVEWRAGRLAPRVLPIASGRQMTPRADRWKAGLRGEAGSSAARTCSEGGGRAHGTGR
eukprot:351469-Chlamydomonas_euryale.AAC.3